MTTAEIIKARVQKLAKGLGRNASALGDDDIIPETGVLDSAAILELIVWVESEFGIDIDQEALSLDNFGSVRRIAAFVDARR